MDLQFWQYAILVLAGFAAGFINTLAGSGTLLTLPLLIFFGLPATIANGTNRIGVLFQTAVATRHFKKNQVFEWKEALAPTASAVAGAIAGALFASKLNEELLNRIIGILLILMFFLILYKPEKWLKENTRLTKSKPRIGVMILFAIIGFYGGFVQVGSGYFLIATLVFGSGFDLLKANAIKSLIIMAFNIAALSIFIYNNQVDYLMGLLLGIGSMTGAWVASSIAIQKGSRFIRIFMLVTILVFGTKLLFF